MRRQGTIDKMSAAAFFLLSGMGLLYSVFLRANYFSPGSSPSDIKDYYLLLMVTLIVTKSEKEVPLCSTPARITRSLSVVIERNLL